MTPEPELIFLVSFPCSHCKATLEGKADQPGAWIRCPSCGRASRAPDALVKRPPPPIAPGEDIYRIEKAPEPKPMTPVAMAPVARKATESVPFVPGGADEPAPAWRVACGTALFLSVMGLLFSFLEKSEVGIITSAVAAVITLGILILGGSR